MKIALTYITLLSLFFIFSCQKIDRNKPIVETLTINGQVGDTIILGRVDIYIEFEVTDDEEVVESRIRMTENANLDSGFFHLNIKTANSNYYKGSDKISIPDSILNVSHFYTLTIDAYDPSGNQAIQKKSLLHFK